MIPRRKSSVARVRGLARAIALVALPLGALVVLVALVALVALVPAGPARAAVPVPGAPQTRPVAIVGATLHPVAAPDVANGTIVLENGRITALGPASRVAVPSDAERVDGTGLHVYPGLVSAWSRLGLSEIESVRASNDFEETGAVNPNVRAAAAFQPESETIPVARSNGVLLAHVVPRGGMLSGQGAVMMLDGWTWEEMTLRSPVSSRLAWPPTVISRDPLGTAQAEERQRAARRKSLAAVKDAFAAARAYAAAVKGAGKGERPEADARWEGLLPVLERKVPLLVEADEVHQIEDAVAFAAAESLRLVLVGGYDAPLTADLLRKHDVPVIVSAVHRLPTRRNEPYDAPFTLPARLREAGVRFCIAAGGGSWAERNLPYQAATAAAHGLGTEDALRAITLDAAKILGVDDRVGSLEPGKDATVILTTGDPLDATSQVKAAFIQGRAVDLNDKQKVLAAKYRTKYERLEEPSGTTAHGDPR
jgi:imidazolonepropionase-like amidohydrolase